jgi:hypothetical protein
MSSPLEKSSAYSNIGTFILTTIILWIMWPSSQQKPTTAETGHPIMIAWIMPSILVAAILGAGVLHLLAARSSTRAGIVVASQERYVSPVPPQTNAATTPNNSPITLPDQRIIVGISPQELCGFYANVTSAQGDRLIKPYIGKWMRLSGEVSDVGHSGPKGNYSRVSLRNVPGIVYALMFFDAKWYDHISVLDKGASATVLGKIASADEVSVRLEDCELIG